MGKKERGKKVGGDVLTGRLESLTCGAALEVRVARLDRFRGNSSVSCTWSRMSGGDFMAVTVFGYRCR